MKVLKWILLVGLLLLIAGAVWRGPLFRFFVTYRSIGLRTEYTATDTALTGYIERSEALAEGQEVTDIIHLALAITRDQLDFTTDKNESDPNKLIHTHTSNCVGYAAFFATTCNHLLRRHHLSDQWVARPHVGQLYVLGRNIHRYFSHPFFYDHDFATVQNIRTGEVYAVDPSMSDCLLIDYVSYGK
jgi:hypothetical protein